MFSSLSRQKLSTWVWFGPALALGLFLGRVASETVQSGLLSAVLLTFLGISLCTLAMYRLSLGCSWPALIFLLYAIYPEPDPRIATMVALLALVSLIVVTRKTFPLTAGSVIFRPAVVATFVAVLFLALFVATLAKDVLPADSGEFQLVAAKLGIAHPPGFPLYTVLAHLATRLPISSSAAYKVNLLSAVTSAATLAFVFLTARKMTNNNIGGLAAATIFGTSTTYWSQATTANIRSLTVLFLAVALYAFVQIISPSDGSPHFTRMPSGSAMNQPRRSNFTGMKYPAILIVSLSLGVTHHPSLAFIGLILILYMLAARPQVIAGWRRKLGLFSLAALGLVPILYLPWRGALGVIGAPEDITTLPGLLNHILALGFQGDLFYYAEPIQLWRRLLVMANVITFQFQSWSIPIMVSGFVLMYIRKRSLAVILLAAFATHTLITAAYRAPQTVEYMLPAYLPLSLFAGFAAGILYDKAISGSSLTNGAMIIGAGSTLIVGICAIVVAVQLETHLPNMLILHKSDDTLVFAQSLLEKAPSEAIILADWHWSSPLWYLQEVNHQRQDVKIRYVFPTSEPYGETWARQIRQELAENRNVITTHFDELAYTGLPAADPLGEAFLFRQEPLVELPYVYAKLGLELGGAIFVEGWSVEPEDHRLDREIVVTLGWRSLDALVPSVKLFVHLVDAEGEIVAQQDLEANPRPSGITLTQFRLTPSAGTPPGSFELYVGGYDQAPLLSSSGEPRTKLATLSLLPAEYPPYTENPLYRPRAGDETKEILIGYDWDFTFSARPRLYLHWQLAGGYWSQVVDEVQEYQHPGWRGPWGLAMQGSRLTADPGNRYVPLGQGIVWTGEPVEHDVQPVPGEKVKIVSLWAASRPVLRDLITSVRLIGFDPEGETWAWWDLDDGVPAMGAIPTLKWIGGSYVRDPRWSTVATSADPGQDLAAVLRVYDSFSGQPLAILDKDIASANPWVPMGTTTVGR